MRTFWQTMIAAAVSAAIAAALAMAQTQPSEKKPAPPAAQAKEPEPAIPLDQALYLIRSSLLTLNDANRSGNYSVLRDLAAPSFRAKNTAADLAIIFNDLRKRNFDLYGAALLAPQLSAPPRIDGNKVLRLAGAFPTQPQQIAFDLLYEVHDGRWQMLGISITTPPAPKPVVRGP